MKILSFVLTLSLWGSLCTGLLGHGSGLAQAQVRTAAYHYLSLPTSAHNAALGGTHQSLIADDATLTMGNPALLATLGGRTLTAGFMTYLGSSRAYSIAYSQPISRRHTFGISGQLMDYGQQTHTDAAGNTLGTLTTKDFVLGGRYAYLLNDRWVGGAALHLLYSRLGSYSAMAMAVDVGLNYYDEAAGNSFSVVLKNVGTQLKKYSETATDDNLPFDLQASYTHKLQGAPLRLSITLTDLTRWSNNYYYRIDSTATDGFVKKLTNHLTLGVDLLATKNVYVAAGYNFRRGRELKAASAGKGAGLSLGAGLTAQRFSVDVAYAKYHVSSSSVLINVSYKF
ncbi:MAG: type IX secretion system protein PorQ [Bacteroidales bacterium]|nr:type IX secretion system protein PorQ [Bacteroidales bacterium]